MEELLEDIIPPVIEGILNSMPSGGLPDSDAISSFVLEQERKIFLDYDVGPGLMQIYRLIMRWNMEDRGKPVEDRVPIRIYIMSWGGDAAYMWAMVDAIRTSKTPIYTINCGMAGSAAAIIFIAGAKRFMMRDACVIIHEGSAELKGDSTKVQDQAASYNAELKRMKQFILDNTKIPNTQLTKHKSNDWYLYADYCINNGVCDVVVDSMEDIL